MTIAITQDIKSEFTFCVIALCCKANFYQCISGNGKVFLHVLHCFLVKIIELLVRLYVCTVHITSPTLTKLKDALCDSCDWIHTPKFSFF